MVKKLKLSNNYSEEWKTPTNLYALASGMYPLIPKNQTSFSPPSIQYKGGGGRRQSTEQNPVIWYKGATAVRPYLQGNYIFQSYKRPSGIKEFSGDNTKWIDKYRETIHTGISSEATSRVAQMNRDVASSMNVQLKDNWAGADTFTRHKPSPSLEETSTLSSRWKLGAGEASGTGQGNPYDFIDTVNKTAYNTTKARMTTPGHGMVGQKTLLKEVKEEWDDIDLKLKKKIIDDRQADQMKINAGVDYFKKRLPMWNAHIRQAKRDLEWPTEGFKRKQPKSQMTKLRAQFKLNMKAQHIGAGGKVSVGAAFPAMEAGRVRMYGESTGFMTSAGGAMTMQLFANRDLFLSKEGAFETYQIRKYVQGDIGAFKGHQRGQHIYEYKDINKLEGHIHYGYARTIDFGKTAAEQLNIESGIKSNMASFLQGTHQGGRMSLANDTLRSITGSGMTIMAGKLRPEVNLVQAGREFNRGINDLIQAMKMTDGKNKPPQIIKDVIRKNRFRRSFGNPAKPSEMLSVWAAPYIAVFDSEGLMSGRD